MADRSQINDESGKQSNLSKSIREFRERSTSSGKLKSTGIKSVPLPHKAKHRPISKKPTLTKMRSLDDLSVAPRSGRLLRSNSLVVKSTNDLLSSASESEKTKVEDKLPDPQSDHIPNYAGDPGNLKGRRGRLHKQYATTAITRLFQYWTTLAQSDEPELQTFGQSLRESITQLQTEKDRWFTGFSNSKFAYVRQNIDNILEEVLDKIINNTKLKTDVTVVTLQKEIPLLKKSLGVIDNTEETRNEFSPDDRHDTYDPDRGRESRIFTDKWFANDKATRPGGDKSLDGSLWEKSMSAQSAATYLYDLLIKKRSPILRMRYTDQMAFVHAMRLLSRPDVRKVENAFSSNPDNKSKKTLREAIIERYGMPQFNSAGYSSRFAHFVTVRRRRRSEYLFELLDNGGKASNATRVALSLGLMERYTSSRVTTDEDEVVRLVELMEPKELESFWGNYRFMLRSNLNTYNYKRVKNFVASNKKLASIKSTAKTWKKQTESIEKLEKANKVTETEEAKRDNRENANKLGAWQNDVLKNNTDDKGNVVASDFLIAKDEHLAAIVKRFSVGASKYTGRVGFSLPKTHGYVKDLAKEIEAWLKTVAKEEKTYFGGKPVIRRYITGQEVKFKPVGKYKDNDTEKAYQEITINNTQKHYLKSIGEGKALLGTKWYEKAGGFVVGLFQYPAAFISKIVSLGRYSMFLSDEQKQYWRASKMGWNSGDRTFLRELVASGTAEKEESQPDNSQSRSESESPQNESRNEASPDSRQDNSRDHIEVDETVKHGQQLKELVENVRQILKTRGGDFEVEMLGALANIARQAEITFDSPTKWYRWNVFTSKRYKINRRQDLVKSIMKLPNRWRVQFLDAFLPKSKVIEKAKTASEAEQWVTEALKNVRKVLIALDLAPKQIFEIMGSLKYGADVGPTFLQLRRYAGKTGMNNFTTTFSAHKVLALAQQLNPKELEAARNDKEMHIGLARQFAKFRLSKWFASRRKPYMKKFEKLCDLLGIDKNAEPYKDLFAKKSNGDPKHISSSTYRKFSKYTSRNTDKRGKQVIDLEQESGYTRYYWEHISGKDQSIENAKKTRDHQQNELDSLPEDQKLDKTGYEKQVTKWAKKFATLVENTSDYNKMLQMALDVWQEGDQYEVPDHLVEGGHKYAHDRKMAFLLEVYKKMETDHVAAATSFKNTTSFGGPIRQKVHGMEVRFVKKLKDGSLDIIKEILKGNYKWFRPASDRDKSYGGGTFSNLNGRVLLEAWTDIEDKRTFLKRRKELKEELRNEKRSETPDQSRIEDLTKRLANLNKDIRLLHIPMPNNERLGQLRDTYTNNGSYVEVVKSLLLHLSSAVEFDKSFVDALIAEGYEAEDLMTLTETYKYLAVQEYEKFLTGGKWTVQWKLLTAKSTERKEGAARLMSAMRELDEASVGKSHGDLGDNKGYFYDTYFDDVDERQEDYVKTTAKYRKNLGKLLWMLSTAAFVPFGAGLGVGLSELAGKLIIAAFFTGQGTVLTALNSMLDPYKHSAGGVLGEAAWAGVKGALLSAVFLGTFELKEIFEEMSWWGESINEIKDGTQDPVTGDYQGGNVDRSKDFFERFTGSQEKRWEYLGKKSAEYGMRKIVKELGKEFIRGIDKGIREDPRAGLVNFKDAFNRAFVIEMLTKIMLKSALTDGATGVAPALDELFGAPNKPRGQYTTQDTIDDFRGGELRRNVRRKIYEMSGMKYATKVLEYAISNQNPAFRPFFEKYDVKRRTPNAQETVNQLKYGQDVDDALFEIELKLKKAEGQLNGQKGSKDGVYKPDLGFIRQLVKEVADKQPDKLKELAETLKTILPQQIDYGLDILYGVEGEGQRESEESDSILLKDKVDFSKDSLQKSSRPKTIKSLGSGQQASQSNTNIPSTNIKIGRTHEISSRTGIENEGNSCYLSAGLNMLAFSGYYDLFWDYRDAEERHLGKYIYNILTDVKEGKLIKAARIKELRRKLVQERVSTYSESQGTTIQDRILTSSRTYSQEDPSEIIGKILDFAKTTQRHKKNYQLEQTSRLTKKSGEKSDKEQAEAFINLPIDKASNLREAMREYSRGEKLTDVAYTDPRDQRVKKGDAKKRLLLGNGRPKVVTFALKRYGYTLQGGATKDSKKVDMPEEFILNGVVYRLSTVIFHLGKSTNSGHYTSKTRSHDGSWKYRNDSRVTNTDNYDAPDGKNPGYMYTYTRRGYAKLQDKDKLFDIKEFQNYLDEED